MGDARAFGAAVGYGDSLFVAGGAGLTGPVDEFAAYDTIGDIWRPLPAMPVGRQNFGMAAASDGGIYVSGGFAGDESLDPTSDFWRYDIKAAVWVRMPDMPSARARHGSAAVGGDVYIVGGEGPNASRVFVFDTGKREWRELAADLPAPRTDLSVEASGSMIYAIGGRTAGGATSRVDALDTSGSARWRSVASMPDARAEAAAGTVNGRIHVAGGRGNDPMRTYSDHVTYDPSANRWARDTPLPLPRLGAAAAGVGGRLVVAGGSGGSGVFSIFTASDSVSIYTP